MFRYALEDIICELHIELKGHETHSMENSIHQTLTQTYTRTHSCTTNIHCSAHHHHLWQPVGQQDRWWVRVDYTNICLSHSQMIVPPNDCY